MKRILPILAAVGLIVLGACQPEKFDYDTFVKWDKSHRGKQSSMRRSIVEVETEMAEEHTPPVLVNKTWRETVTLKR